MECDKLLKIKWEDYSKLKSGILIPDKARIGPWYWCAGKEGRGTLKEAKNIKWKAMSEVMLTVLIKEAILFSHEESVKVKEKKGTTTYCLLLVFYVCN